MLRMIFTAFLLALCGLSVPSAPEVNPPVNLLSLHEGTVAVAEPESYGGWLVENLLDDSPATGWACPEGRTKNNIFVFEMAAPAVLEYFELDNAAEDDEGAGAKEILVEVSGAARDAGYSAVLQTSLTAKTDRQRFAAGKAGPARWVRLTIQSNQGNSSWTELFGFRGFGKKPASTPMPINISGTYSSSYSLFHVRQQGTALAGCYEYNEGILTGTIEGRVMKLTRIEPGENNLGPAVLVFAPDGNSFRGYWWRTGSEQQGPGGRWDGTKTSAEAGGCPHWSGSVGGELKQKLTASGRASLYGILFDLDSATIRPESKPVLDEVVTMLRSEPGWKLTIEGHTDSTGPAEHNLQLSRQRADAVKACLTAAGIDAARLRTAGFGASKPVSANTTELGRARNRRVELVKE